MPDARRRVGPAVALILVTAGVFALAGYLLQGPRPVAVSVPEVACATPAAQMAGQTFTATPATPLKCADLQNSRFDGLGLEQFHFEGADLTGASLRGAKLGQASLNKATLTGAHLEHADLDQADLSGADLRGADLAHTDLSQATLTGADLRGADLTGADLSQATLTGADLHGADLNDVDLTQADLTGADLRGAHLWWVDSVQAETSRVRMDLLQPGVVQLGALAVAAALVLLLWMVITVAVARLSPAGSVGRLMRLPSPGVSVGYAIGIVVAAFVSMIDVAPLWTVRVVGLDLVAVGVLLLARMVRALAPGAGQPAAARVVMTVPA